MVYGATDGEARRKADTIDAEIRNRKAAGERVISIAAGSAGAADAGGVPAGLARGARQGAGARARRRATRSCGTSGSGRGSAGGCCSELDAGASSSRFRAEIEAAGAGAPTVLRVLAVLGSVLSEAVRQGQIATSPTRAVSRPRQRRQRAVRPPTPERVEIIRAGLDSDVDRALVTLLAYVGSAAAGGARGGVERHHRRQARRRRVRRPGARAWSRCCRSCARSSPRCSCARVGPGRRRRSSRPRPASSGARAASGRSGGTAGRRSRPGCGPYDLRHAYVSLMIQAGHTVVEVAKWAGHSPQVCLGTYAHLFDTVTERIDPDLAIRAARYGTDADRAAGRRMTRRVHEVCTGSGWYDDRPRATRSERPVLQAVRGSRPLSSVGRALPS